jgi:hypothetical protein
MPMKKTISTNMKTASEQMKEYQNLKSVCDGICYVMDKSDAEVAADLNNLTNDNPASGSGCVGNKRKLSRVNSAPSAGSSAKTAKKKKKNSDKERKDTDSENNSW